jgi:phage terminase small subunit
MIAEEQRKIHRPLTTKQQRFVDVYDGNATKAARKAGYKGNDVTLATIGKENIRKHQIKAAIRSREKRRNKPLIATREERQEFWTAIMDDETKKDSDRLKASELLGRSEADFVDKAQLQVGPVIGLKQALDAAEGTGKIPIKEQ